MTTPPPATSKGPAPAPAKGTQPNRQETSQKQNVERTNHQNAEQTTPAINQTSANPAVWNQQQATTQSRTKSASEQSIKVSFDLITVFTGVLAVVAVLQWWAMRRQAKLMGDQLSEMKTTSADTHALAVAADSAAKATEAQAQLAQSSVEAVVQQNTILSGQTQALIESAKAAKESADSTQQMLKLMDRAWISVRVKCTAFEFQTNGTLFLFFDITLENVGRTVANKIQLRTRTIFPLPDEIDRYTQPISAQDAMIANPDDGSDVAITLFPNAPSLAPVSNFVSEEGYRVRAFRDNSNVMRLEPIFVGVVLYQYPHSTIVHSTRFAYEIRWHNSNAAVPEFPQLPIVGQTIRRQDILFSPFIFGGHDAD